MGVIGYVVFFVAVTVACLAWTAFWTALAVRAERGWVKQTLVASAVLAPLVAWAPWVVTTGMLASTGRLQNSWFGPALAVLLLALAGGLTIVWLGTRIRRTSPATEALSAPSAAAWPLVPLAATFVLAKLLIGSSLTSLDDAVAAQAAPMRAEAAAMMQVNLPPIVGDDRNAAPLYARVFELLEGDPALRGPDSPLAAQSVDVAGAATSDLLARHASTLELLRQAADREVCRFSRDWTRPNAAMLLPELQSMRTAARLLSLAARRAAVDGDVAKATGDVVRLQRIGRHAGSEPLLISGLVGLAIDAMSLETLAQVLPSATSADLPLLNSFEVRRLTGVSPSITRSFFGEEAFGLSMLADLADGRMDVAGLTAFSDHGSATSGASSRFSLLQPASMMFRAFLANDDIAGYRALMRRAQEISSKPQSYAEVTRQAEEIHSQLRHASPGVLTALMMPAIESVYKAQVRTEARHAAAEAMLAAVRRKLETGAAPASLDELVPGLLPFVPHDPFTGTTLADRRPVLLKTTDDALVFYSVGPNGKDDGGPKAADAKVEGDEANDDIGLRWRRRK